MSQLLRKFQIIFTLLVGLSGFLSVAFPSITNAADDPACSTCPCVAGTAGSSDPVMHFVLVNIHKSQYGGATFGCTNVPFNVYLSAVLDSLVPWIFTLAIVMIVFSGVQYMASAVGGGDTKAAKQRIVGSIIGVAFFFLIRLVLNQITPNLSL